MVTSTVGVVSVTRSPFPLLDQVPAVLQGVILDFHWDLARLHNLQLTSRSVAVRELAWHLQLPFWAVNGVPFQVAPVEVATASDRFRDQWERTLTADLSYPLDGHLRPDGQIVILDGVHRLLKASVLGQRRLSVRILHEHQLNAIAA